MGESSVVEHLQETTVGGGVGCAAGEFVVDLVGAEDSDAQAVEFTVHCCQPLGLGVEDAAGRGNDDHIEGVHGMEVLVGDIADDGGCLVGREVGGVEDDITVLTTVGIDGSTDAAAAVDLHFGGLQTQGGLASFFQSPDFRSHTLSDLDEQDFCSAAVLVGKLEIGMGGVDAEHTGIGEFKEVQTGMHSRGGGEADAVFLLGRLNGVDLVDLASGIVLGTQVADFEARERNAVEGGLHGGLGGTAGREAHTELRRTVGTGIGGQRQLIGVCSLADEVEVLIKLSAALVPGIFLRVVEGSGGESGNGVGGVRGSGEEGVGSVVELGGRVGLGDEIAGGAGVVIEDVFAVVPVRQSVSVEEIAVVHGQQGHFGEVVGVGVGLDEFRLQMTAVAIDADILCIGETHGAQLRGRQMIDAVVLEAELHPFTVGQHTSIGPATADVVSASA